jgi:IS605 OrfB family transposase
LQKEAQICVVGKVFRPNKSKVLALNKTLSEYFKLVKWYLGYNSTSKKFLHEKCYEKAKELFNLNTALIQTARDKAVEILKGFEENRKEGSVLKLKRTSIRFDKRCYSFSKNKQRSNAVLAYTEPWQREENKPIVFGERQRQRIEEALKGEWQFATVEMVKRDGEWYAHFILKKTVEVPDEPETVIAIDRGERNLAVAVAISKENPSKPMKGNFWKGAEVKRTRGKYAHVRRKMQRKKLMKDVKKLKDKEKRIVEQQLHATANEIVAYARQFSNPLIVMEDLTGIRDNFDRSKKLNRRFHSLPFRKLQEIVEYKALLEGIEVKYLPKKEVRNTSRTCHRCGHVAQTGVGRIYKCPKCGMEYDRDLNACINIARRLMRSAGWGSCEPPGPADEGRGVKPSLNAGSSRLKSWSSSLEKNKYSSTTLKAVGT